MTFSKTQYKAEVTIVLIIGFVFIAYYAWVSMKQAPLSEDVLVTLNGKPFVTTQIVSNRIEMANKIHYRRVFFTKNHAMEIFNMTCLSMLADEWLQQHPEHIKDFYCKNCYKRIKDSSYKDYMKHTQDALSKIDTMKRYEYQLDLDNEKATYFTKNALKPSTPQETWVRSHASCPVHSLLLDYLDEIRELFDINVIKEHLITFLERYRGQLSCVPQLAPPNAVEGRAAPFLPKPSIKP